MSRKSDVLKRYPQLKNGFIRFAIHRRENVSSYHRFVTVFEAMEELVKKGKTVLWLSHNLNKEAIKNFGLTLRLKSLIKKYPNFIYQDNLWIYDDNIAALNKASLNVTDSGSEQEETNMLQVPSVTIRFNSDRPETCWAGSNLLAPPLSKKFILQIVEGAENNQKMRKCKKLYGSNISEKLIKQIDKVIAKDKSLFQWSHEQYGFNKSKSWQKGEINQL
jgi:UDP-N-acetylglucosamine 2-epimerase (non-hydrolysing)